MRVKVGGVKIWRSRRKLSQYLNGPGLLAPAVSLCVGVMVVEVGSCRKLYDSRVAKAS